MLKTLGGNAKKIEYPISVQIQNRLYIELKVQTIFLFMYPMP